MYKLPILAYVCFSKLHLRYQWQTTLDQKPHKSAAFSPDRMYSGYLLKVAVKPYFYSDFDVSFRHLHPMRRLRVSFLPNCDNTFNCKIGFYSAVDHVTFTGAAWLRFFFPDASVFSTLGFSLCHWDPWLHDWMWGRCEARSSADGGEGICIKSALLYEGQRYTHRKDPTSGLQAEWVHYCLCCWMNTILTWNLNENN